MANGYAPDPPIDPFTPVCPDLRTTEGCYTTPSTPADLPSTGSDLPAAGIVFALILVTVGTIFFVAQKRQERRNRRR